MAPTKQKKGKGEKAIAEPAQVSLEDHPDPTIGNGKFYYPNGATYEGEWIIAPDPNEHEDAQGTNNNRGSKDQKKGDKSSKDDNEKQAKSDAKVNEKNPPKSPKKEATKNKKPSKGDKSSENKSPPPGDATLQQEEEHPRPNFLRHGKGLYMDGEYQYEGEWKDDQISGLGTFRYASGATYEGNWEKNKYSGEGEYKWGDGRNYKGYWRESKMHGMGGYTDQSGQRYVGHFFNGVGPGLSCDIK